MTFHPHPRVVLGYEVQLLTTFERRLELLAASGADDVLVIEFTPELARFSPHEFVLACLEPIGTRTIVAGEDFRFGRGRSGSVELLREMGFDVRPVEKVGDVSSSNIRAALRDGDVVRAAGLLGRPARARGARRGR